MTIIIVGQIKGPWVSLVMLVRLGRTDPSSNLGGPTIKYNYFLESKLFSLPT